MNRTATALVVAATAVLAAAALASASSPQLHAARYHTTWLISHNRHGGTPNGPSTHAVISGDKRYARIIAFQSEASDLVSGDHNGVSDVFAIRRAGSFGNEGSTWQPGKTILVSKGLHGNPANGPSFAPAVDGNYYIDPHCVAFLSAASNLVKNDTNGKVDAFVSEGPGGKVRRVSYPGGHQATEDSTAVAIAGDCSRTAFVVGDHLYVRRAGHTTMLHTAAHPADPSFAAGDGNDLVFGASGGVYLSRDGTGRPGRVADGRNPAFNHLKRQVVVYETRRAGHWQIGWRDLGHGEQIATSYNGTNGNADSRNPVVTNSGYYIGFETDASNLGTRADRRRLDGNGSPDTYLYTGVRNMTLLQSVGSLYGRPLADGGNNPSVSYYANYFVFDSTAPLDAKRGDHQIFMRYLGGK